jgi:hypothetical protein
VDVDECGDANAGCAQICVNAEGTYTCACDGGWLLDADGRNCSLGLRVYADVPGLAPSEQYRFRVRPEGTEAWLSPFAFITRSKETPTAEMVETRYFSHLNNWSNTYINFEMAPDTPVEIEIARVDGTPIESAVVRPVPKATSIAVKDGKALLVIENPALFTVDIDGQMDDQDTGKGYNGPPIHTLTIFANPILDDPPDPADPRVHIVMPGAAPPDDGDWDTLYFASGVHDVGLGFRLRAQRSYYIPGDAIVYGTMNNASAWSDGHDIRIYGHGTLSGARLNHPADEVPPAQDHALYTPIEIVGAGDTVVEGITIADAAYHTLMLIKGHDPAHPTDIRWVKILNWRANGDGINPFGNVAVEDSFIRTQDDSIYVSGRGIRRVVFWNDANGSVFVLSRIGGILPVIVEDCDVVYSRAFWHQWRGGRIFNMRGEGGGGGGPGVVFRNIRVEDPRPTLQQFFVAMEGFAPYDKAVPPIRRAPGDLTGILFQNIHIAAPSVLGEQDTLWGMNDGQISGWTFQNVTIGGVPILSLDHFVHNEFVSDLVFLAK